MKAESRTLNNKAQRCSGEQTLLHTGGNPEPGVRQPQGPASTDGRDTPGTGMPIPVVRNGVTAPEFR